MEGYVDSIGEGGKRLKNVELLNVELLYVEMLYEGDIGCINLLNQSGIHWRSSYIPRDLYLRKEQIELHQNSLYG